MIHHCYKPPDRINNLWFFVFIFHFALHYEAPLKDMWHIIYIECFVLFISIHLCSLFRSVVGMLLYGHGVFVVLCGMPDMPKFDILTIDVCANVAGWRHRFRHSPGPWAPRLAQRRAILQEFDGKVGQFRSRSVLSGLFDCRRLFDCLSHLLCVCMLLCSDGCDYDRCEIITWRPSWHPKWLLGH